MATSTLLQRASESRYFPVAVVLALTSITGLTIGSIAYANIALNASQALKNTMMIVGYGLGGGCTALTILTLILTGRNYRSISEQELKLCLCVLGKQPSSQPMGYFIAHCTIGGHTGEWICALPRGNESGFFCLPRSQRNEARARYDRQYAPVEDVLKAGPLLKIPDPEISTLSLKKIGYELFKLEGMDALLQKYCK